MYGRGEKSIAEQLGCKVDEAKQIKNNVYEAFPKIKVFEEWSKNQVQQYGFVTTLYGRKRRLPDYNMPRYVIYYIDGEGNKIENMDIPQGTKDRIAEKLNKMYRKDKEEYITKLQEKDNIKVIDNGGKISAAGRQIINSQVQGCLDGDVRVQSKEFGIVKIKDFVGKTLTLWDGHEWTPGTIVSSGKKQKCIIHFIGGQKFICSPDHKFETILTDNQHTWCKCAELKHALYVQTNRESVNNGPVYDHNLCVDYVEITDEYIDMYDVCNTNNGYFIADGLVTHNSAADMSKLALVKIYQDEELTKRGVKLIIPVHDEILIETPLRHARFVKTRFAEDMMSAGKPQLTIPVKCDVVNSDRWTGEEINLDKELEGVDENI